MDNRKRSTTFIYMGDAEPDKFKDPNSYNSWKALLHRAYQYAYGGGEKQEKRLLVLAGDLVRRSRQITEKWQRFFEAGGELLENMQVIPAIGNHDCRDGIDYLQRFCLPANGPAGFETRFYSYDADQCHFLVLDTNCLAVPEPNSGQDRIDPKDLKLWMEQDLSYHADQAIFAVMHHPMFSVGTSASDDQRSQYMQMHILPVLQEYSVDMILCGHQHLYCRTTPDRTPIVQIMGVSGTKLFTGSDLSSMDCVCEGVSVATIITVDSEQIQLVTIDGEGQIWDTHSQIVKRS